MLSKNELSTLNPQADVAQQNYLTAFRDKNFSLLLELAKTPHSSFNIDLNPLLFEIPEAPTDFVMTLAAELLTRNTKETTDVVLQLLALPGFKVNKEILMPYNTLPMDVLHVACWFGCKEAVEVCLALLLPNRAEAYLNQPIKMTGTLCATPLAMAFINTTDNSEDIAEMLYKAGGDPYIFFISQTGNQKSLLSQLDPDHPSFNNYIKMLKSEPKKLAAFLNKKMAHSIDGKTVHLNIMEECALTVLNELKKQPPIVIPTQLLGLVNQPVYVPTPAIQSARKRVESVKKLYEEFCFALADDNKVLQETNWQRVFNSAKKISQQEETDYKLLFSGPAFDIGLTAIPSQSGNYLPCTDRTPVRFVEQIAGVSGAFFGHQNRVIGNDEITGPLLYQENMRKEMQPYIGVYKGHTPISLAALNGNHKYIKLAIAVNHPELNSPVVFGPFKGCTPLIIAIFTDNNKIVLDLLSHFSSTQKLPFSAFSKQTLSGEMAGLTLETAITYAHKKCQNYYNQLIKNEKTKTKPICLSPSDQAAAASKKQTPSKKPNRVYTPTPLLASAEVAAITPSNSNTTQGYTLKEANHLVEVYNSQLQQYRVDAGSKIEQLVTLTGNEQYELHELSSALNRFASITQVSHDDDTVAKVQECNNATDALNTLFRRFNALYRDCARNQKQQSSHTVYDPNATSQTSSCASTSNTSYYTEDDDNTIPDASIKESSTAPLAKPEIRTIYGTHDTNYTVLRPSDSVHHEARATNRRKPNSPSTSNKISFEQLGQMFGDQTPTTRNSALQMDSRAYNLMKLCQDRVDALNKSYIAYQQHCLAKQSSGLFDVDSAIAVGAMSADTLAIYETLLILQRDYPAFGVFKNQRTAAAWRDMSKYAYVFIFSHEGSYFETLIAQTLTLISSALTNRLHNKRVELIDGNKRPLSLVIAAQAGSLPCDKNQIKARYINLLSIIEELNSRHQKPDDLSNRHQQLVRARLFCLALLGQVIKENGTSAEHKLNKTYSDPLVATVIGHAAGNNFTSDTRTEKTSALLNFFSRAITMQDGKEVSKQCIRSLSVSDMALLLREILNVTSHQIESEWVTLENRHIREVADCIAMQCQKAFSSPPASYADRASALLRNLTECKNNQSISQLAARHIFFATVEIALNCIATNNTIEHSPVVNTLFESFGGLNRFDTFAKNFNITGPAKETLDNVRTLILEALNRPDQELTTGPKI